MELYNMPYYDFYCEQCDKELEINLPIAKRNDIIKCEQCQNTLTKKVSLITIGYDNFALTGKKPDEGFRDKLREMKRNIPGNTINVD